MTKRKERFVQAASTPPNKRTKFQWDVLSEGLPTENKAGDTAELVPENARVVIDGIKYQTRGRGRFILYTSDLIQIARRGPDWCAHVGGRLAVKVRTRTACFKAARKLVIV